MIRIMKSKTKRIWKWVLVSVASLLAVVAIAVAIALNFVFTPSKLTPAVEKMANGMLDAKVSIGKVDLTFFSTFPRLALRMEDVSVVSRRRIAEDSLRRNEADSLAGEFVKRISSRVADSVVSGQQVRDRVAGALMKRDSLLGIKRCVAVVNLLSYFRDNRLVVNRVRLDGLSVYAYLDENGVANWNIFPEDSSEVAAPDSSAQESASFEGIELKRLNIRNSEIVYNDRTNKTMLRLRDLDTKMAFAFSKDSLVTDLDFNAGKVFFSHGGKVLAKKMSVSMNTSLVADRGARILYLRNAGLGINDISLEVDGTLARDTVAGTMVMDLRYGAKAPSVEKALALIPESVVKSSDIQAKGSVLLEGTVKGEYGDAVMPVISLKMKVDDASAHYKGLPYGIDYLVADFDALLDFKTKGDSYVDLKIFNMKGMNTDILADAKVTDVFDDPYIELNTKSVIDLDAMSKTFPLKEGISISGRADADIKLKTRLSTIKNQNFGKVFIAGKLDMDSLCLKDTNSGFEFSGDADAGFFGGKSLGAKVSVNSVRLKSRMADAYVDSLGMRVWSEKPVDSTRIFKVMADVKLRKLFARQGDSVRLFCAQGVISGGISPQDSDPSKPHIDFNLKSDSLFAKLSGLSAGMKKGVVNLKADKVRDSLWNPKANVNFSRMEVRSANYALPLKFNKARISFADNRLDLNKAKIRVGRSDLELSGYITNPYMGVRKGAMMRGKLDLVAKRINCNQLMRAYIADTTGTDMQELEAQAELSATDTVSSGMHLFKVPSNIDFTVNADVKKLRFGKMVFDNIKGKVEVRDSHIYLEDLKMNSMGASLNASMIYRAATEKYGYTGFDLKIKDIDIARLVSSLPSIDTLIPMLQSFKGKVNADMAAEAVLDSVLNIKIPSLRSALYIRGDSLVLMDGETFAEISKKLMFKNKKENLIDSISVNVTVDNGNINIYPFIIEIDRYRAAAGGTQYMDMSFDYHISILKSPLPFKAGVNISGTLDKMKFGIGRAKYKNAVTPVEIYKVDTMRTNLGKQISDKFRNVAERKKWSARALKMTKVNWTMKADSVSKVKKAFIVADSVKWDSTAFRPAGKVFVRADAAPGVVQNEKKAVPASLSGTSDSTSAFGKVSAVEIGKVKKKD